MKGDFSRWEFDKKQNFSGVLHQQGKVLLDSDWNAQTRISNAWRDQAGRDIIGPLVAAVPAHEPNGFKVLGVTGTPDQENFKITLHPGRVWADGILLHLPGDQPVNYPAHYMQEPQREPVGGQPAPHDQRDAVILEVWREAVNGFQLPQLLTDPALGGIDTAERIHTSMSLRLLPLTPGDDCRTIHQRIADHFDDKGKLTVTLQPTTQTEGECPKVAAGGYTGFEHRLYRVEVAHLDPQPLQDNGPMFKWSRYNGGLVGRGDFEAGKIKISKNSDAIQTSGEGNFYLEILQFHPLDLKDTLAGHWRVVYGAKVSLDQSEATLDINDVYYEHEDLEKGNVFFRLWNGIEPVSSFVLNPPTTELDDLELENGIFLQFQLPDPLVNNYKPGDYWTFKVRAGFNKKTQLISNQPPEGIHYHRVPLAILDWSLHGTHRRWIHDCREIFNPLTDLRQGCCTVTVGVGGDFQDIQDAIDHLPDDGGQVCIMPGFYYANAVIQDMKNVTIRGCGPKTRVVPVGGSENPIFHIKNSQTVVLEDIDLFTLSGTGVLLEDDGKGDMPLKDIEVRHTGIHAFKHAIRVENGKQITIEHNKIWMFDKEGGDVAIYLKARESAVRLNYITVVPWNTPFIPPPQFDVFPDPYDLCFQFGVFYQYPLLFKRYVFHYMHWLKLYPFLLFFMFAYKTPGGIRIAGGSEEIKVTGNTINGGSGNGITLGNKLDDIIQRTLDLEIKDWWYHEQLYHSGGVFQANFAFGNVNQQPVTALLMHNRENNQKYVKYPDSSGQFSIDSLPVGNYMLATFNPHYALAAVERREDPGGSAASLVDFTMEAVEIQPEKVAIHEELAVITGLWIEDNRILNMGQSGIAAAEIYDLDQVETLISTDRLTIIENEITNCLNTIPTDAAKGEFYYAGIVISDGEHIMIKDNRIQDNGGNQLEPVSGIFIYNGQGVDISGNIIVRNGPKNTTNIKPGFRGGIVVKYGTVLMETIQIGSFGQYDRQDGFPALKIHNNIVVSPVGPALFAIALGPVSVVGNQFTSKEIAFNLQNLATTKVNPADLLPLLAGTVFIVNLGRNCETYFQFAGFRHMQETQYLRNDAVTVTNKGYLVTQEYDLQKQKVPLVNGNVLFSNNQCVLDLLRSDDLKDKPDLLAILSVISLSATSVAILSLDNINFNGNQLDSNTVFDIVLSNAALLASAVSATSNRFKAGVFNEFYSLYSLGYVNITQNNIGTHCFLIEGIRKIGDSTTGNIVLADPWNRCTGRLDVGVTAQVAWVDTSTSH